AARGTVGELGHGTTCSPTNRLAATGCSLLRRLERVLRANLFLADALALVRGTRRRLGDDDVLVLRTGDRAAHEDAVLVREDLEQLEVLDRDLLVTHLTRHALALVDALRGEAAADRAAVAEILVRTVGAGHARHVVLLDDALVALALAPALDIDRVAVGEHVLRTELLTDRVLANFLGRDAQLADEPLWLGLGLLRDAELGL